MAARLTATVIDGTLKLDQPVDLPNNTRVRVAIEPLPEPLPDSVSDAERRAAWERLKQRIKERPLHLGGQRFSRDELYEDR